MVDAKQQRFQGFRPGTVPPHLLVTYKKFAMDETARETVMEALSQNNVKPFEKSREEATFATVSFVPPKRKKKGKKKKKGGEGLASPPEVVEPASFGGEDPMMEAVKVRVCEE